jgi:hypothetical protein
MDLTPEAVYAAIFPVAAFANLDEPSTKALEKHDLDSKSQDWDSSILNPKNRINSLNIFQCPKWAIDGCASMGTQFYTIPLFLNPLIPMRIDTYIPAQSEYPPHLRDILQINQAFVYRDGRIMNFGIARYILQVLEYWTNKQPDFPSIYQRLPFGSRIVFENIATDINDVRIQIVPTHYLERQLLSVTKLQTMWADLPISWPEVLDISDINLLSQIHDSVSLVQIPQLHGEKKYILKALTDSPKYLYHELKLLLSMPAHAYIISPPLYLVAKLCQFGGKQGVIGFVTAYQSQGTLRDILPFRLLHSTLAFSDQVKWALQITEAMQHIRLNAKTFYSDLRLDNILLTQSDDILLIDFEQRGVGSPFAAPEVKYLEYIDSLAHSDTLPEEVQAHYHRLFERFIEPHVSRSRDTYRNEPQGFCIPWLCLTAQEQESAEVYMLGRLLWCIFEGVSGPETSVTTEAPRESNIEFPEFSRTPEVFQELILRCKTGWRGVGFGIARLGSKLVVREKNIHCGIEGEAVLLREWWRNELKASEEFLEERQRRREAGHVELCFVRPSMKEVLQVLQSFQEGNNPQSLATAI